MAYWLMKSEPDTYSWDDLNAEKQGRWDGVRNYQARNFIGQMQPGDIAFFYHSNKNPHIIGEMKIVSKPYQDPTTEDPRWLCVDVKPLKALPNTVSLSAIKANPACEGLLLITHSRLSVMPVDPLIHAAILEMAKKG